MTVKFSECKLQGSSGIASALSVSAFNIGAVSGSSTGGLVIESSLTSKATPWIGVFLVLVAMGFGLWNWERNWTFEEQR